MSKVLVKGVPPRAAVLGGVASLGTMAMLGLPASAASGDLDLGFGGAHHGRVVFDLGSNGQVTDLAVQPGGGVVTVGVALDGGGAQDAVAARFNADGSRDARFGTVKLPGGAGPNEAARAVVAQPDGKLVVVGTVTGSQNDADFGVWRLTASGALDSSFGGGDGFVELGDSSTEDQPADVAVDGQGRIVVAGQRSGSDSAIAVVRLTPNGALDDTFNQGSSFIILDNVGQTDRTDAVAVQPGGKIVVAGAYDGSGGYLLRITPGTATTPAALDGGFGNENGAINVIGSTDAVNTDIALGARGGIFMLDLTRSATESHLIATVVRLTSAGAVDESYGSAGGARVAIAGTATVGHALAALPHGGVVVVGDNDAVSYVAKFRPDGNPDLGMGPGGVKTLDSGTFAEMTSGAALPDGRVVAAGRAGAHAVLYRLLGDLKPPKCAGERATIVGTKTADRLVGTRRADVVAGLGGSDRITGLGKGDVVCGGAGNDRIVGGSGDDELYGQTGRDTLIGGKGRDELVGGTGRDTLSQ